MNSLKTTNTILGNLEEFLSISSIGIFLADISGRILKLNKPLLRLLKVIDEDQAQKIYNENVFNIFNDKENIKKSFSKLSQ